MKLYKKQPSPWYEPRYEGRYKKCVVTISATGPKFYWLINRIADEKYFNSLWENLYFDSIEQAADEAKRFIDG